ncbi:NAD(P)-binding domain-containing protein [Rhodobacter sp. NTK016B]|uniref:NADPH-dependent F420 reductase n=1 Tax=Rhodobacter sp. NTK016B TaxID=2759676 RepID=UPI001A8C2F00|nr:NAD(P)-binding domain-containing protein [Rhodobacter sp. NTK016B]MBN8291343.1 NAD(P)-binding domain-containing protein [Rhodobacter sp. NTK016B]
MTEIAILGSGRVASVLTKGLLDAGHSVTLGRRDPESPRPEWATQSLAIETTAVAISRAEIVINATPGETSIAYLAPHADGLRGKVLLDVSNALKRDDAGHPAGLLYPNGSVASALQDTLPDVRVVKALNTMLFIVMANPGLLSRPPSVFLSGNDPDAKMQVRSLLTNLGWAEDMIEDLGGIATASGPESFMLFVPPLMARDGMIPFALSIAR